MFSSFVDFYNLVGRYLNNFNYRIHYISPYTTVFIRVFKRSKSIFIKFIIKSNGNENILVRQTK